MGNILLYHYYFEGIKQPLIIQSPDKSQARPLLPQAIQDNVLYRGKTTEDIISETVSEPVSGISMIMMGGVKHVWDTDRWVPVNQADK